MLAERGFRHPQGSLGLAAQRCENDKREPWIQNDVFGRQIHTANPHQEFKSLGWPIDQP